MNQNPTDETNQTSTDETAETPTFEMHGTSPVFIEAPMSVMPVTTAPDPTATDPARRSSIGVSLASAAEIGGVVVMLSVVDGQGTGSVAFLDQGAALATLQMLHGRMIAAGFLPSVTDQLMN